MTSRVYADIDPALLRWARRTAGYDLPTAAAKLGQDARRLEAWEAGEQRLTVPQLRKAAQVYRRPLAVFYLSEPPKGFSALRDFRRLPRGIPKWSHFRNAYRVRRRLPAVVRHGLFVAHLAA